MRQCSQAQLTCASSRATGLGGVLTLHKVRAGVNLPDDLAPMRTSDSTVLIVQKIFRQDLIYIPRKERKQSRETHQLTADLEKNNKRAKDINATSSSTEEKAPGIIESGNSNFRILMQESLPLSSTLLASDHLAGS